METLNWTDEAERWLQEIHDYIALDDAEAAQGVVRGIIERVEVLTDFPEIGYRYEGSVRPIRILLYGHYRIAYVVRRDGVIDILGVFHGALDLERYLK
jgi:toxin ParE1/3/4